MYTLDTFRNAQEPINFSKWEHTQYQQILHLAEKEIDLQKRKYYYLQAEELLLEEMPTVSIFSNTFQALKKKNFKLNFASAPINFKWASFDF
jgi:ABC-type transport system substrate-binding protein